jgi:hypothetical protein
MCVLVLVIDWYVQTGASRRRTLLPAVTSVRSACFPSTPPRRETLTTPCMSRCVCDVRVWVRVVVAVVYCCYCCVHPSPSPSCNICHFTLPHRPLLFPLPFM